ncbi:hypothetical protein TNCV_2382871 [Trichonephila clavipes]|nr:hypothetical protein TNCV_2382871 [Trichonephila clavipes]
MDNSEIIETIQFHPYCMLRRICRRKVFYVVFLHSITKQKKYRLSRTENELFECENNWWMEEVNKLLVHLRTGCPLSPGVSKTDKVSGGCLPMTPQMCTKKWRSAEAYGQGKAGQT